MNVHTAGIAIDPSNSSSDAVSRRKAAEGDLVCRTKTDTGRTYCGVDHEFGTAAAILMRVKNAANLALGKILKEQFDRIGGSGRNSQFMPWLAYYCPNLNEKTAWRRRDDYAAFSGAGNVNALIDPLLKLAREMSDKGVKHLSMDQGATPAVKEELSQSPTPSVDTSGRAHHISHSLLQWTVEVAIRAVIQSYLEAGTTEEECLRALEIVMAYLKRNIAEDSRYEWEHRKRTRV